MAGVIHAQLRMMFMQKVLSNRDAKNEEPGLLPGITIDRVCFDIPLSGDTRKIYSKKLCKRKIPVLLGDNLSKKTTCQIH